MPTDIAECPWENAVPTELHRKVLILTVETWWKQMATNDWFKGWKAFEELETSHQKFKRENLPKQHD
jgi:hypothetical protein